MALSILLSIMSINISPILQLPGERAYFKMAIFSDSGNNICHFLISLGNNFMIQKI